jgi:hypothetical protein
VIAALAAIRPGQLFGFKVDSGRVTGLPPRSLSPEVKRDPARASNGLANPSDSPCEPTPSAALHRYKGQHRSADSMKARGHPIANRGRIHNRKRPHASSTPLRGGGSTMHDRRDLRNSVVCGRPKLAFNLESNKARGDNRVELVTAASGVKVTGSAAKSVSDLAKELGVLTRQALATNLASSTSNWTLVSRANPSAASTSPRAPMLAFAGGFIGPTLGGSLSLSLELRDRTFRTSTQVKQQTGSLRVGATPRVPRRGRKSPADVILNDKMSVLAEAFRLSWASIQLTIEGPKGASFRPQRPVTVLGVTSAIAGEGKSTHALAVVRTAALAGETIPAAGGTLGANRQAGRLEVRLRGTRRDRSDDPTGGPMRAAAASESDVQRLYENNRGSCHPA